MLAWSVAVVLLSALLRFVQLGHEGLWCDEAYTALTVRQPWWAVWNQLRTRDDAPPLFYLLQYGATRLFGDSEAALRGLSALVGVAAVGALLHTSRARRSRADLWAAAILGLTAVPIFHSRQARSYALLLLCAAGLVLAARAVLLERKRGHRLLAISALGLCLTHHVGVLLVLTSLVLWPLGAPDRPRFRVWLLCHLPALAASLVLWSAAPAQLAIHAKMNAWVARYWETHPIALAPLQSLRLFLPLGLPHAELSVALPTLGTAQPLGMLISLVLGLVCLCVALRSGGREVRLELGFLLLPLVALAAASLVVAPAYVLGRTDVIAFPAFALLLGRGLAKLPPRFALPVLLVWVALSVAALAPSYGWVEARGAKGVDRQLASSIAAEGLAADDWLIHTFMTAPSIEYYLDRAGAPHRSAWFPAYAELNTASDSETPADSLETYRMEAERLRERIESTLPIDGEVWVLSRVASDPPEALRSVRARRTIEVSQIAYPTALLVHAFVGTRTIPVAFIYRQDWVAGDWVVLRLPRSLWISPEEAAQAEFRVTG